jgi:two-component system CheB/CheR fusion protein
MEEAKLHFKAQIYSTDLDDEAIAFARRGHYPAAIAANISAERLSRFFVKTDVGYRIATDIREMVVFAVQSVISDPPFTKLDLLSCRHLMIYLEPELQNRVIPVLHYALKALAATPICLSRSAANGNFSVPCAPAPPSSRR